MGALAALWLIGAGPAWAQLPEDSPAAKAGSFMLNARVGAALGLHTAPHQLAVGLEAAYAITPDRAGYLILPLLFQTVPKVSVGVPLGVQYDIAISTRRGLFLYPRLSLGYFFTQATGSNAHAALILPEFGIKYVVNRRVNVGLEPFSLLIAPAPGLGWVQYRLLGHVGVNF